MSAISLLLYDKNKTSIEIARKSLIWVKKSIENNDVYGNKSSILGYSALNCVIYKYKSKETIFDEFFDYLINNIIKDQKDGLWESSAYQSSYIFYDLAHILKLNNDNRIIQSINNFLDIIDNNFFTTYVGGGQRFYLVASSLLRGLADLFEPEEKNTVIFNTINSLIELSSEYFHKELFINKNIAFINEFKENFETKRYLPINPKLFTKRKFNFNNKNVFVIMPFGKKEWIEKPHGYGYPKENEFDFDSLYSDILKPSVEELGLNIERANSSFSPGSIMEKIWTKINEAAVIITFLTSTNPNVLYELGISHTLGKPVILLTQRSQDVPTDIKSIEYIKYNGQIGKEKEFKEKIQNAIREIYKNHAN